jgi:hypothetical protein
MTLEAFWKASQERKYSCKIYAPSIELSEDAPARSDTRPVAFWLGFDTASDAVDT